MRQSTFMPHALTLLAGAMATLASTQALAETAGRVSFVTGNVTASTPDGQSRALRRGDAINGGDRLETRGGRLQIRFTDGGFVSLQPNTVFGVDQYLYANKAPEETSLFFSLLRGGMRTVTGAIGKVNKQSYKVRTPVATIGIRGTGYRATTDDNRTLVSVGHGAVSLENVFGSVTAGSGQNIMATNDQAPALTREAAKMPATGPEGDIEEKTEEAVDDVALASDESPKFGDQVTRDGDSLLGSFDDFGNFIPNLELIKPAADILRSSDPTTGTPIFSYAAPIYVAGSPNFIHPYQQARFDGSLTANRGGVLTLSNADGIVFDSGSLNFNDVTTLNSLSWGEFTDGAAAIDNLGTGLVLSAGKFEPYIIGYMTPSLPNSGKASYSLQGHSTPRLNQTMAGTLDNFSITIDFDFALLDLFLGVTVNGLTANVTGTDLSVPDIFQNGNFSLSSSNGQLTVSGSACTSSCSTDISGFFAGSGGSQIGAAYSITTDNGTIKGVAALGQGGTAAAASALPDAQIYTMATTATGLSGAYPSSGPMNLSLLGDFDGSGALVSAKQTYPSVQDVVANTSATASDVGTSKSLSWGQFNNGAVIVNGSATTYSGSNSLHYVIGQETPSSVMFAQSGTATYGLIGHTTGSFTGADSMASLSGTLTADFASSSLGVAMTWAMTSGKTYSLNDSINLSSGVAQFSDSALATTGTGGACASTGCSTSINGFFSGQQAQQIGLSYVLQDDADTLKGTAAFKK